MQYRWPIANLTNIRGNRFCGDLERDFKAINHCDRPARRHVEPANIVRKTRKINEKKKNNSDPTRTINTERQANSIQTFPRNRPESSRLFFYFTDYFERANMASKIVMVTFLWQYIFFFCSFYFKVFYFFFEIQHLFYWKSYSIVLRSGYLVSFLQRINSMIVVSHY